MLTSRIAQGFEAFLQDLIHDELQPLREEILAAIAALGKPTVVPVANTEELLTVRETAEALKVIPATVRSWIQSGALKASRPGDGKQPGRTYRVRRADLDAFILASQNAPPPTEVDPKAEVERILAARGAQAPHALRRRGRRWSPFPTLVSA